MQTQGLEKRISDLRELKGAERALLKIDALIAEVEARRSECRQCGQLYIRKRYREDPTGFCLDTHRAEWHRQHGRKPKRRAVRARVRHRTGAAA